MSSFLIAPISVGLERDVRPWLLPDTAFPNLTNAFLFRGRVERKLGAERVGSLCLPMLPPPALAPPGPFLANPANSVTTSVGAIGLVPGSLTMTATSGFPTSEIITDPLGDGILSGAQGAYGTVNYATGAIQLTFVQPNAFNPSPPGLSLVVNSVCVYPSPRTPVMGIGYRQEPSINFEETIFFDQVYSYRFGLTGFSPISTTVTWHGNDSDFFWMANARNPLAGNTTGSNVNFFFATNFNNLQNPGETQADPIRYLQGTTWMDLVPFITGMAAPPETFPRAMYTARCIVPFKNRLLFFNTWEGQFDSTLATPLPTQQAAAQNYPNRLRYSWIGNPVQDGWTVGPVGAPNSGYIQSPAGRGGFVDAATGEQITSVAVLKDCILVKFETESWRVVYTQNPFFPFEWQRINSDLGSDSTFSTIGFDTHALTVGNRAITMDTSQGVQRIDEKIPDVAFEIHNTADGTKRVHGIRDFYREQVYWTYATTDDETFNFPLRYPNRMLNYSYRTNGFGFFKDVFTTMGRFQNQTSALWGSTHVTWGKTGRLWGSASNNQEFEQIAAGNQQGNVFLLQQEADNDPMFEIESIVSTAGSSVVVTLPIGMAAATQAHNIENGDFVIFTDVQGFDTAVVGAVLDTALMGTTTITIEDIATTPVTVGTPDENVLEGSIVKGSFTCTVGATSWADIGNGVLLSTPSGFNGYINYEERSITLNFPALAVNTPVIASYSYSWLNGRIFGVGNATRTTLQLMAVDRDDDQLFPYFIPTTATVSPFTWGQIAYLTNFVVETKQLNPLVGEDTALNLPYVDLYLDGTDEGSFAFGIKTSDNQTESNVPLNTYTGAQWTVSTASDGRDRLWQRVFVNSRGEFIQIAFTMSNYQMAQGASFEAFALHGILLRVEKSGRLIRTRY